MLDFLRLILCGVIAYLLGSIQTGLIVGRAMHNVDLRKHGSGNSGATNALRTLGRHAAGLTLLGDFLKGVLAVGIGLLITGWYGGLTAALFVVVGHIWPVFFGFHGGKGAATSLGALLPIMPWQTLLLVVVGVGVLLPTKTVSLASLAGAVVFLISGVATAIVRQDWFQLVFVILISGIIIFAHRENIDRLRKGKENQLNADMFKKK